MPQAHDPIACPTYTAISYDGETIDASDNLDDLLRNLDRAADARHGLEELVIWKDAETVAAILKADARIVRLDGPQPELVVLSPEKVRRRK
jgi:hypothetical protein